MYDVNLWCLRTMDGPVFDIYGICMALFCVLSDNFSPTSIWNRKSQVEPWKTTRKIPCSMKSWLVKNKSLHFLGEISEKKQGWYHTLYVHIIFNQPDRCSLLKFYQTRQTDERFWMVPELVQWHVLKFILYQKAHQPTNAKSWRAETAKGILIPLQPLHGVCLNLTVSNVTSLMLKNLRSELCLCILLMIIWSKS